MGNLLESTALVARALVDAKETDICASLLRHSDLAGCIHFQPRQVRFPTSCFWLLHGPTPFHDTKNQCSALLAIALTGTVLVGLSAA